MPFAFGVQRAFCIGMEGVLNILWLGLCLVSVALAVFPSGVCGVYIADTYTTLSNLLYKFRIESDFETSAYWVRATWLSLP